MTFPSLFVLSLFLCLQDSAYTLSVEKFHNISTATTIPCEDGWYYFEDKCYKVKAHEKDEDHVPWEVAESACLRMGANLASIHSMEENDFISTFVALNAKIGVWIGLEKSVYESNFQWTDRSPVEFLNWDQANPSNNIWKHCAILVSDPHKANQGKWIDNNCNNQFGYICEKGSNQALKAQNPVVCSSEGGGWKFQNSCYNIITDLETWDDAEKYCKNTYKSHLVTIPDMPHDFFLDKLLSFYKIHPWIGIKLQDQFQQKWASGSEVIYTNLHESVQDIETGSCVMKFRQSLWSTAPCKDKRPFVCERSISILARSPDCPRNLKDIGGEFCYYIDEKSLISWYQAQNECIKKGGLLAKISSKDEEKELRNYIKDTEEIEAGLHIGLNRLLTQGERFIWSDGSDLHYTNWGANQPNFGEEECVDVMRRDMTWHDFSCTSRKGFICQIRKEIFNEEKQMEEVRARTESTSSVVYVCILLSGVIFALLAYISKKWIKSNIDVLHTMFVRSTEKNKWSDETLYTDKEDCCL